MNSSSESESPYSYSSASTTPADSKDTTCGLASSPISTKELPVSPKSTDKLDTHRFGHKKAYDTHKMLSACSHFCIEHPSRIPRKPQTTILERSLSFPDCNVDHTREKDVIFCSLPELPSAFRALMQHDKSQDPGVDLQSKYLVPFKATVVVDTKEALEDFLINVGRAPKYVAEMYLDLEGDNHDKNGTLSTVQFTLAGMPNIMFILDVCTLGERLFHHVATNGKSVKGIVEDPKVPKVLFDVRQDSTAMYGQYGVRKGVFKIRATKAVSPFCRHF